MQILESYVSGRWHRATGGFAELEDPCSEERIGRASSRGIDFAAAVDHARRRGGPALRALSIGERGALLRSLANALQAGRDELLDQSIRHTGATRKDAKFDVDGGIFTLAHYAELGESLGDRRTFADGDGVQLGRTPRLWGCHLLLPRGGAAVHINAFNFPVWGFAEKAACALLAGMPVITKPATSTATVAERAVRMAIDSGALPEGSLSLICGSVGDLLDRLGPQDVLAFTGSASTALGLRGKTNLLAASTRVNVEADSLNAAVCGPDVAEGTETWGAFVRDVVREITQKTGQKCTAVRRVIVPRERLEQAQAALAAELSSVVVGNPVDPSVGMGPLATAAQLEDALSGVAQLGEVAQSVLGSGRRINGKANPEGKGYFLEPTLLRVDDARRAAAVHEREIFGPVATLLPYDGSAQDAAEIVALAGGTLVTSLYSDDREFVASFVEHGARTTGRLYIGSEKVAGQLPGSGLAMPDLLHGGPGRAGGGEELGGLRGLAVYLQRVALSGDRSLVERLAGHR